ncbi:hypothetical protein EGR_08690 [Echinococcus granulosus]|uniref:Uncharacterized protein n=1 Tax=Echinococcus granulosus TaxID=6210 RepID=W6U5N8_ECHGR|nr:hypothetical protein EGR_08690 [Echinococcus granulosus]EUB56468.1 hypothetical protein EGR_08690 [Echinococcus granulosus]
MRAMKELRACELEAVLNVNQIYKATLVFLNLLSPLKQNLLIFKNNIYRVVAFPCFTSKFLLKVCAISMEIVMRKNSTLVEKIFVFIYSAEIQPVF